MSSVVSPARATVMGLEALTDEREGRAASTEDTKAEMKARAARMLPFTRYLVIHMVIVASATKFSLSLRQGPTQGKRAWRPVGAGPPRHHLAKQARTVPLASG
jgi:hypothetical protein